MTEAEEYVVTGYVDGIANHAIQYAGCSELEAYREYKRIKKSGNARMVRAIVTRDYGHIEKYEILEVIREESARKIEDWRLDWSPIEEFKPVARTFKNKEDGRK